MSFQFLGPDSYASPNLYPDAQLPGWLYLAVQGDGHIESLLAREELGTLLIQSTRLFGAEDQRFSLEPGDPRIDRFIDLISGFRIEVQRISGIAKLAQDKGQADARLASDFLAGQNYSGSLTLFDRILRETL